MRVGLVGVGRLGLPCAVAIAMKGHDVMAYDIVPSLMNMDPRPDRETGPDGEEPFNPYLARSNLRFGSLKEVLAHGDVVFVAVQTPHEPRFEGVTRLPGERMDFNYHHLVVTIENITAAVKRETVIAIISTVLPGTVRRYIRPVAGSLLRLCYNPFFIAMGTTMRDFLQPEFVLLGVDDSETATKMATLYATLTDAPICQMSIDSAELTKVAYNTFIGMKIAFANTLMEICHKSPGAHVNDVTGALKKARRRLLGPQYLDGGMGDGGGCHPRDNIAMSWLARELPLSHDIFENMLMARERHTEWLVDLMCAHDLPKAIIGYSFKAGTNLTVGSPALLLNAILEERGFRPFLYDPLVEGAQRDLSKLTAHVFLIGTRHQEFTSLIFPEGSVVIDPWRYLVPQDGVTFIPVGIGPA
jgi:UDPglucose 6-dehydrogenase